ncbi:hypothetical protein X759_28935 [Mesorhizobium sp. LSHC420B00]|nr:hypothetical protein X759_28935 [Mesorhizobium sp. LSHC420B00]
MRLLRPESASEKKVSRQTYPRFGRTMEWDTAAGDAVLRAAGGMTRMLDSAPLACGKRNQSDDEDFANPHFIASGKAATAA